jgi:hypothetical protein
MIEKATKTGVATAQPIVSLDTMLLHLTFCDSLQMQLGLD